MSAMHNLVQGHPVVSYPHLLSRLLSVDIETFVFLRQCHVVSIFHNKALESAYYMRSQLSAVYLVSMPVKVCVLLFQYSF